MKKSSYFFVGAILAGGIVLDGCKSSSENVEAKQENVSEAKQDLDDAQANYTVAVEEFRTEANERISRNERDIARLKERIETEKKSDREARRKHVAELENTNEHMKSKLAEYKENGREGWESFKKEFNHDMDELGKALKDLTVDNEK